VCGRIYEDLIFLNDTVKRTGSNEYYIAKLNSLITPVNYIKNNNNSFHVFPNPGYGVFSIDINDNHGPIRATIFSTTGQLIEKISLNSKNKRIDISKEPDGIYFIQLEIREQIYIQKVIKSH